MSTGTGLTSGGSSTDSPSGCRVWPCGVVSADGC